ncbi:MAG: hypothetical protein ACRDJB_11070 [Actinomycetota bacterium]
MSTAESSGIARESQIDGLAAAALLAAGLGAFVLGLLTTLAEASTGIKDFLQFNDRVGPLSGKTIFAAIAYFGALLLFGLLFRGRQLALRPVLVVAVVLLLLGLLGTFPTFFQAFA